MFTSQHAKQIVKVSPSKAISAPRRSKLPAYDDESKDPSSPLATTPPFRFKKVAMLCFFNRSSHQLHKDRVKLYHSISLLYHKRQHLLLY